MAQFKSATDPATESKRDAQLRASALDITHNSAAAAALSGTDKAAKLVALVDPAMRTTDPHATLTADFARYFDVKDAKVGDHCEKLSDAVHTYVDRLDNPLEKKQLLDGALLEVLAFQPPIHIPTSMFHRASVVGNSDRMMAFVDNAMGKPEPELHMEAAFSRYLNVDDRAVGAVRVGRLSQAVHDYVTHGASPEHAGAACNALRNALASLPLLDELDRAFPKKMTPKVEQRYFSNPEVNVVTHLRDGQVNPYIFQWDQSGRGDDMTGLVDTANTALITGGNTRGQLMSLKQAVQGKVRIGETSVYEKYQRFEEIDLGIGLEDQSTHNAYTILGLGPDVDQATLDDVITGLHSSNYVREGVTMSQVRNAVYQLQMPEGKAEYDLYLNSKTTPGLADELRSRSVSADDAKLFGTVATGIRMHALLHSINKAIAI